MDFRIFDLIANASSFSVLLPLTVFFIFSLYQKNAPYTVKVLGAFLLIAGLSDLVSTILIEFKINPNPVISAYIIFQFISLSSIYRDSFSQSTYKKVTNVGIVLFLIFAFYNLLIIQGITGFNSNSFTISSVVFIVYSIAFFYRLMVEMPVTRIELHFMFWVNSAIFIYFANNLFIFISIEHLIKSENDQLLFSWAFHNCMNILRNVMFAISFYVAWCRRTQ